MEARQIDNKGRAKSLQIKTFRQLAYGTLYKIFEKTSTFSLKDERVLLLSHTLQAAQAGSKNKMLCHTPIAIHKPCPTNKK